MSTGGTVRSELLDRIGHAIGLNVATLNSSYRKYETLLQHFGGTYDPNLDSSEHSPEGGGTISAHGWRKLAMKSGSAHFCFILNYAEADVSEKYEDSLGKTYGFTETVSGRKGLLETGAGAKVLFYNTANSKRTPNQAFIGSATVTDVIFEGDGQYRLKFGNFTEFANPISKNQIEIDPEHKWNNQHAIVEISSASFDAISSQGAPAMPEINSIESEEFLVDVRPDPGSLRVYKGMNYTPHYALGEFIDNSISSALENRESLTVSSGEPFTLQVAVNFDASTNKLIITDNAAGISKSDIGGALKAGSSRGETRLGLGKYGIGMKAAAFWFGSKLTITTHPLGEPQAWEVTIDIGGDEEVPAEVTVKAIEHRGDSGTIITVENLWNAMPKGKSLDLIGKYLPSIYRSYISGELNPELVHTELKFQGKSLKYTEPQLLEVPFWPSEDGPLPDAESKIWRQEITVRLSDEKIIKGWVGILKTMSRDLSGLTLFYKKKAITGALPVDDESDAGSSNEQSRAYKPGKMFGQAGSKIDQSFVGEFDVTEFGKTLTTDLPHWSPEEKDAFEQAILDAITIGEESMMKMAKNYRRRLSANSKKTVKDVAVSDGEVETRTRGLDGKVGHGEAENGGQDNQFAETDIEGGIITSNLKDDEGHLHSFVLKLGQASRNTRFFSLSNSSNFEHEISVNVNHPILDGVNVADPDVRKVIQYLSFGYAASEVFADSQDGMIIRNKFNNIMELLSQVGRADDQDE